MKFILAFALLFFWGGAAWGHDFTKECDDACFFHEQTTTWNYEQWNTAICQCGDGAVLRVFYQPEPDVYILTPPRWEQPQYHRGRYNRHR